MYAWVKAVKWWAVLRYDDLAWLAPTEVTWCGDCLHFRLLRTKTSGPGKKVPSMHAYVSVDAWFSEPAWLQTGWDLWVHHGFPRDFFVARPTPDLSGLARQEATYEDAAAMSRRILSELKALTMLDGPADVEWVSGDGRMVLPEACPFWTEHSERNGLPSAAAALGFPSEWTDTLGRWTAKASACYIRTQRQRVLAMQARVAGLRNHVKGPDRIGETETTQRLAAFLRDRAPELSDDDIVAQVERLAFFQNVAPAAAAAEAVDLTCRVPMGEGLDVDGVDFFCPVDPLGILIVNNCVVMI